MERTLGPSSKARDPKRRLFDERVLLVMRHPRFRGGYLPLWRIVEALDVPSTSQRVSVALRHLESEGRVERRKRARISEWRIAAQMTWTDLQLRGTSRDRTR